MPIRFGCDIFIKYRSFIFLYSFHYQLTNVKYLSTLNQNKSINKSHFSMMSTSSSEDIEIMPFEPKFQNEVEQLFRDGLSPKTYNYGPTVAGSQNWFVNSKLSKDGGDMFDIYKSYINLPENEANSQNKCKHFWVALDKTSQKVVGHVGVIMSTYKPDNTLIYHSSELNPSNTCELVRMGVHSEYRGKKIGKRLCETLEKYAKENGIKQMVLSTLEKMDLARFMYEKYGFRLVQTTKIPIEELLGPGDWEQLNVVHYVKEVTDIK